MLLYSEEMAEGGRGGLRGLQMCMDTNLRLTASELIFFQELVKSGGANDELKMSQCAGDLAAKVPSSIAFFEKILDDHLLYLKNVHPQIFQYCGTETPNQLVIAKFLMFWYVIRPFTPVAACEERFTLHTIQHAFFEFSSYIETLRVPLQVQSWTNYVSTIQHQNFQASLQQTKTQYESYSDGLKSILNVKTKEYETEMKALTLKLEIKSKELQDLTFQYEECKEKAEQEATNLILTCEQLKIVKDENSAVKEQILAILCDKAESEKKGRESQQKCEILESKNRQLSGSDAELRREIKSLKSISSAIKIECASYFDEKEEFKSKFQELEFKVQSLESQNASLSSILAAKKTPLPQHQNVKDKELKTLRAEYAKSQKIISDLEEELVMFSSNSNSNSNPKIKWNKKEGLDTNVEEARVLVDLCATTTKAEKIVQVLQNYVVSSLREKKDEEFPAWLVVGQSILRSIFSDVGLARGYLHSHYKNYSDAATGRALQLPRDDVFMGLLCWKVESRFRALSWLRNRVVRGFSSSGKMGNVNLQSFLDHVVEQQRIGGKITLAMGKTSPDLALEISSLNVLKRETLMLLDKNSVIPVSGAVFIPTVPASMADGVFLAVRNFALLNVCCFISLMESDSDSFKKNLLDIVFDLFDPIVVGDGGKSSKSKNNEIKTSLTPDRFALAHKKVTAAFSSLPDNGFKNFTPLLNQLGACADSFQDLYAKTFLFFDAHSSNEIDFFRKKRMLTLYNHADSLLDSFWSCQEISRHSAKVNEDLPDSLIGKIMAMEVLWNEENESIDAGRKQTEALLLSLSSSSPDPASEIKCASTIDETNFFMHSLSHLIVNGNLLISAAEQEKDNQSKEVNSHSSSEDIIGFLCNEMQGCELREFITAIQESIHCFREVRKGKQVMVEGKSSLGKILQTLSSK